MPYIICVHIYSDRDALADKLQVPGFEENAAKTCTKIWQALQNMGAKNEFWMAQMKIYIKLTSH